jgi:hypothetical protein
VPVIILLFVFLIDSTNMIGPEYKPEIGLKYCWIKSEKTVEAIYIFLPVSVIIIFNTFLYTVTAIKICRIKEEIKVLKRADSQKHSKSKKNNKAKYERL